MGSFCQWFDRDKLKEVFRTHWESFKGAFSRYREDRYAEVVQKMLGCGDAKNGYATYEAIEEFRLKGKGLSFSGRMGLKQTSLALGCRIQWIGERMKGVGFGGLDWGKGKDLHWVLGEIKETRRY